ncbi:MAG TPA: GNAT family N-acetyltransferase [Rhizomicrobium sp.]
MRPVISLRRAEAGDAAQTALVFTAALKSMRFFPKLHSDDEDCDLVGDFIDRDETWIATEGGLIRGLACIREAWLDHLYVSPGFHNRGVGSALLAKVRQQRPAGFRLWTFQANTGARRFYERHGCKAIEFTNGSRNEEKLPDVLYVWTPTNPPTTGQTAGTPR